MNNMKYYDRISKHFDRGVQHGQIGIYKPGLITGVFRRSYQNGYQEGNKMRGMKEKIAK